MGESTCKSEIAKQFQIIRDSERKINEIAGNMIPDFHFLNHKVSNFWDCDKSPIGWCVWDTSDKGYHIDCSCHFCGEPVERK